MNAAEVIQALTDGGAVSAAMESEHDAIDGALRALSCAILAGAPGETIRRLVQALLQFCGDHFRHEEAVMLEYGYAGLDSHRAVHERMLDRLRQIESRAGTEEASLAALEAAELLHDFNEHVERGDRAAYEDIERRLELLLGQTETGT